MTAWIATYCSMQGFRQLVDIIPLEKLTDLLLNELHSLATSLDRRFTTHINLHSVTDCTYAEHVAPACRTPLLWTLSRACRIGPLLAGASPKDCKDCRRTWVRHIVHVTGNWQRSTD